ncbi:hypothetical protein HOD83_00545 [Candidatus Woesearchaeota archaeon]|jgi:uncharacterized protein YdeI (BOF family)|nr:hypothetical protein [Candidatus Woesearchaeota archaeon]MBT4114292.1 hypothetical protein [Candidatus Woesearchaeota archaeon]MBT4248065.1 hypothetical protein [Candidatus Woesearchaeota archaeon]
MPIEQPPKQQFKKRDPSKQVLVKNLDKDMKRISLVGTIVTKNDSILSFLLDDGTGTVNVIINDADLFGQLTEGQIVRVMGRIWGEEADIEIQGDIVQDFSKLDMTLFKQVFS